MQKRITSIDIMHYNILNCYDQDGTDGLMLLFCNVNSYYYFKNLGKIEQATDLPKLDKLTRDKCLKELKETYDLSIRQIERLTGINRGIVAKA
ncbi:hypothetical protein HKBW3S06_00818 [Candidatus Hakubella thermalkaliphila]|uniref:Uncharacterized protein n=1 Tax=Candidatus Hakubella thermalkaliphila TaxID=2754717 RepID=A0A6V8NQP1_9ACTN|nr:hypothetical protein HKBW3S06_00818 [Candidatus Hakubella thermalkaliphila]